MGATVNTTTEVPPQEGATSADYQVLVDASELVLDSARSLVPAASIVRDEPRVSDLETDRHRMSCSDTTSQYVNIENLFLAPGTDEIAIVNELRSKFEADGWSRKESVAEQQGEEQDETGTYVQTLSSPDGYGLSVSRGEDTDGSPIVQLTVYSPCIGNPTDKPSTWGLG
jgi:hypothetical protein